MPREGAINPLGAQLDSLDSSEGADNLMYMFDSLADLPELSDIPEPPILTRSVPCVHHEPIPQQYISSKFREMMSLHEKKCEDSVLLRKMDRLAIALFMVPRGDVEEFNLYCTAILNSFPGSVVAVSDVFELLTYFFRANGQVCAIFTDSPSFTLPFSEAFDCFVTSIF